MSDQVPSKMDQSVDNFLQEHDFPRWMRASLQALGKGQEQSEDILDKYEKMHRESLKDGQHPDVAVICDGNEKYTIGQSFSGDALVFTGAYVLDKDGNLSPEFKSFLALVGFKHLQHVYHDKSSASRRVAVAFDYLSGNADFVEKNPIDKTIIDYAESLRSVYEAVMPPKSTTTHANPRQRAINYRDIFKSYDTHGVNLVGTPEEKTKQAMALEQFMREMRAYPTGEDSPTPIHTFTNYHDGRKYIWIEENGKGCFEEIPPFEDSAKKNKLLHDNFRALLPEGDEWDFIAHRLRAGATKLHAAKQKSEPWADFDLVCCSDSRQSWKMFFGKTARGNALRVPGGICSTKDKKTGNLVLNESVRLALALSAHEGRVAVIAQHADCGAMGAIKAYNADPEGAGKTLPKAFQNMAEYSKELYDDVYSKGKTEQEIVDYFRKSTGVPVTCIGDCFSLQQLQWDIQAVTENNPDQPVVFAYHGLDQIYVFHPEQNKFFAMPKAEEEAFITPKTKKELVVESFKLLKTAFDRKPQPDMANRKALVRQAVGTFVSAFKK